MKKNFLLKGGKSRQSLLDDFMQIHSLIWKAAPQKVNIEDFVLSNLNLTGLIPPHVIQYLCLDAATIQYRQDILQDFSNSPELLGLFEQTLSELFELEGFLNLEEHENSIFNHLDHLVLMEKIIGCVEKLSLALEAYPLSSEGLCSLRASLDLLKSDDQFLHLKKDTSSIRADLDGIKSVDLIFKVHLNAIPIEGYLIKTHDQPYEAPHFLKQTSAALVTPNPYFDQILPSADSRHLVSPTNRIVLKEIALALKSYGKQLKAFSIKYTTFDIKSFFSLKEEMSFYQLGYTLIHTLEQQGLPTCRPQILQSDLHHLSFEKGYALSLALQMMRSPTTPVSDMVFNDLSFAAGQIYLLTGANRGGKTTFTQAVGQIQILAQLGFYVPCEKASISPVDHLFTHFPVTEQDTVDLGRFGEECQRFSAIFSQLTGSSLLLMNESFSGTSHLESLVIAEETVKALKFKKIRTLFNTHLHELSANVATYNAGNDATFTVVSLSAQADEGQRSYKIEISPPVGKSYANEIAEKYGTTYDQLLERLNKRGECLV